MVPVYDRRGAVRVQASPRRDFIAMVALFGFVIVMSIFAANVTFFGEVASLSDRSVNAAKYMRDGGIPLMLLYLMVFYPTEVLKFFYAPVLLIILSAMFRSEYFSVIGAVSTMRITLAMVIFIVMYKALEERGEIALEALVFMGLCYVAITLPVAIMQVLWARHEFGVTFFGSRALGFNENPGTLAQSMASIILLVILKERRSIRDYGLMGACVFLAVLTGGRGGQLSIIMAFICMFLVNKKKVTFSSVAYIVVGLVLMPLLFRLVLSDESVSGRVGTSKDESFDGRVEGWADRFAVYLSDPSAFLFGYAPGMGVNGLVSLYNGGMVQLNFVPINSDGFFMFFLMSFGFVGLAVLLCFTGYFLARISYFNRVLCLTSISPIVLSSTPFELYPVSIFMVSCFAVMWWQARGRVSREVSRAVDAVRRPMPVGRRAWRHAPLAPRPAGRQDQP